MVRLQSNHFNINETASKVEFHVEWQVELQGVKEVGWVDENLTQCWVRSPIFGYRMETTHLKKSLGIKKNWVFVLAYTHQMWTHKSQLRRIYVPLWEPFTQRFSPATTRRIIQNFSLPYRGILWLKGKTFQPWQRFTVNPIYPLVICYIQRKWPWK